MPAPIRPTGGQNLKVLKMLEARDRTTSELAAAAHKYTSRVSDLRKMGWKIRVVARQGDDRVYRLTPPA